MKILGNWSISFFTSFSSISSLGGTYIEHIFTTLYSLALIKEIQKDKNFNIKEFGGNKIC